jgi:hypothetical protein
MVAITEEIVFLFDFKNELGKSVLINFIIFKQVEVVPHDVEDTVLFERATGHDVEVPAFYSAVSVIVVEDKLLRRLFGVGDVLLGLF